MQVCQASEKKNFEYFFENLPFMSPCQPIKLSDLDKSRMKHGELHTKRTCICGDIKSNITSETAETVKFHFSTIETRVLIRPE